MLLKKMGNGAGLSAALLVAALIGLHAEARADTTVNTETLRLTFDARGNLTDAIACFPACSGEQVRVQQFGDQTVVGFAASGQWRLSERTDGAQRVLEFAGPGGAALNWRIPGRARRPGSAAGWSSRVTRSCTRARCARSGSTRNWTRRTRRAW